MITHDNLLDLLQNFDDFIVGLGVVIWLTIALIIAYEMFVGGR